MTTHPSRASGKERAMRHRARVNVRVVVALALAGVTLAPAAAQASKTFVPRIKQQWGIGSLPVRGEGCTLCHQNDNGKSGTIDKPFGKTMQAQGLKGARVDLLVNALLAVQQHATVKPIIDSDRDKVADYLEIAKDHTDPNDPKSFHFVPPPPPPMGGEGGQAGESAGVPGGEGGTGEFEPSGPAPYTPPPAFDVPPPFEHGCGVAPRSGAPSVGLFAALAGLAFARRAMSRRTRPTAPPHC